MATAFLGVDIGGTNTKLAVADARGRVVRRDAIATAVNDGPHGAFERLRDHLADLIGRRHLRAVGVGCAGLIERGTGRIHDSPNLRDWEGQSITRAVRDVLGVEAVADNDVNAAAYGEYRRGCARGATTFVCITLGTGVGGGIVHEGTVIRGARNFAGEIGHMTLNENGPRCKCGNKGCLEAYLGTDGLVRHARRLLRRGSSTVLRRMVQRSGELTPKTIVQAARRGDPAAREVVDTAATHLGVALANVVNLLNPDVIGIGGAVAGGYDLMRRRVRAVVSERAFRHSAEAVTITRAELGNYAAAVGGALMALDQFHAAPPRSRSGER